MEKVKVSIVIKQFFFPFTTARKAASAELEIFRLPGQEGIFMPFMTREALRTCCPQIAAFLHICSTKPAKRNEMQKIVSEQIKPGLDEWSAVFWTEGAARRNRKRKIWGPI